MNEQEIIKIALMYYEEGKTQSQIAKILNVSRSLVSKYLIEAKKQGIIEVVIHSKSAYAVSLERELEEKYNLKNAIVVDSLTLSQSDVERYGSQYAASYIKRNLENITKIGISWGKSIKQLIDHFPHTPPQDITIIPMIGGIGDNNFDIHSNQLCYDLARKLRSEVKYLYTPAMMSNQQLKEDLLNNTGISQLLEEAKTVDFAVVGVSSPFNESTMLEIGYLSEIDIEEFRNIGVMGDINSRFFDKNGKEVNHEINNRVISMDLDDLSKIPNVMALAYKMNKVEPLKIAMENKLVNIVVTTDKIAEAILKDSRVNLSKELN